MIIAQILNAGAPFFSASLKTTDSWRPPPHPCIPSRRPKITSEEKVKCESIAGSVLSGSRKRGGGDGGWRGGVVVSRVEEQGLSFCSGKV